MKVMHNYPNYVMKCLLVSNGSGIEDGPEVPEVQRQHNVQRTTSSGSGHRSYIAQY